MLSSPLAPALSRNQALTRLSRSALRSTVSCWRTQAPHGVTTRSAGMQDSSRSYAQWLTLWHGTLAAKALSVAGTAAVAAPAACSLVVLGVNLLTLLAQLLQPWQLLQQHSQVSRHCNTTSLCRGRKLQVLCCMQRSSSPGMQTASLECMLPQTSSSSSSSLR